MYGRDRCREIPTGGDLKLRAALRLQSRITISLFLILPALLFSNIAWAKDYDGLGPISVRNQNPVYLQNLGLTPTRAETLAHGTMEMRVDSAYSNLLERAMKPASRVDMDMELWRIALHASYGLTRDFEVGMEIPFYNSNHGFLDGFVDAFHDVFRFPTGSRKDVPNNRYSYTAFAGGRTLFDYPSADFGLGDIVFHVKNQLTGEDDDWPALSWFADLKLPTGKKSRGFGSGAPDFGFGAAMEASYQRLHGHVNTAYFALGGNDMIDGYQYNDMFAYMLAGEVTLLPTWSVIAQLAGSTPLLHGIPSDQWNGVPLELTIGVRGEEKELFKKGVFIWQFGFSEDVACRGPSIDFTVFASIGFRFDLLGRKRPVGDWIAKNSR